MRGTCMLEHGRGGALDTGRAERSGVYHKKRPGALPVYELGLA